MKIKPYTFSAILIASLALGGCVDRQAQKQSTETQKILSNPVVPVTAVAAKRQNIAISQEISGSIATSSDTVVGSKLAGKITAVFVKQGDPVVTGQLIASLDTSTILAQLRQAQANLASARAQLSQARSNALIVPRKSRAAVATAEAQVRGAKAQLAKAQQGARPQERRQAESAVRSAQSNMETAQKDLDRTQKLVDQGALPAARLDQSRNAYQAALSNYENAQQQLDLVRAGTREEDIRVAQEAVQQAQEAVQNAKAQQQLDVIYRDQVLSAQGQVQAAQAQVDVINQSLEDARIRAPFSGKIADQPVQAGTVVSAGGRVARLIGVQGIYFEGDVPESALSSVRLGSPVGVKIDALQNRIFSGRIAAINPLGNELGRLFSIRVQLVSNDAGILPGMFARGVVQVKSIPNALVIPTEAIVKRSSGQAVFIVKDGKAAIRSVTVGAQTDGLSEITGVSEGDQVIVKGQEGLAEGTQVQIEPAKQAMLEKAFGVRCSVLGTDPNNVALYQPLPNNSLITRTPNQVVA